MQCDPFPVRAYPKLVKGLSIAFLIARNGERKWKFNPIKSNRGIGIKYIRYGIRYESRVTRYDGCVTIHIIQVHRHQHGNESPERNRSFIGVQKIIHGTMKEIGDQS